MAFELRKYNKFLICCIFFFKVLICTKAFSNDFQQYVQPGCLRKTECGGKSSCSTQLHAFSLFGPSEKDRESAKEKLLDAIAPVKRGLTATPEQTEEILQLIEATEKLNPTKSPLVSKEINAKWELIYTTSDSILGKTRPDAFKAKGPIYQTIDAIELSAKNEETIAPLPFLSWKNAVTAELTPRSKSFVDVKFITFFVGPLKIQAPDSARGALDTTYLDSSMRISRGDKGNVFVLVK